MSDDELLARFLSERKKISGKKELKDEEIKKVKKELIKSDEVSFEDFLKLKEKAKISPTRIITITELLDFLKSNLKSKSEKVIQFIDWAIDALYNQKFTEFLDYMADFKEKSNLKSNDKLNSFIDVITTLIQSNMEEYDDGEKEKD